MANVLTFYQSYHENDRPIVEALTAQLQTLSGKLPFVSIDYTSLKPEENTTEFTRKYIETADVVLLFCSADYFNKEETLRELEYAKRSPRNPLIIPLLARAVSETPGLEAYALLPANGIPLYNAGAINDLQCALSARNIHRRCLAFQENHDPVPLAAAEQLPWEDIRTRLLSFLDKNELYTALVFFHALVKDPEADRIIFQALEMYEQLHRRSQSTYANWNDFWQAIQSLRYDTAQMLLSLQAHDVVAYPTKILASEYLGMRPIGQAEPRSLGLQLLADEVAIPQTKVTNETGTEQRTLSSTQQQEFKRLFILAQDAYAIGQFARAFALAEQIRQDIDPESAQLYEFLLLSLIQKDGPDAICSAAVSGRGQSFETALQYALRFREFQNQQKCRSETGYYNAYVAANALQSGLRRAYSLLPNDYILDTGLNAERHPDRRENIRLALERSQQVYNFIHPSEAFLEIACNELCGGGKYNWVKEIEVENGRFSIVNRREFDLLSEINHLLDLTDEPPLIFTEDPVALAQRNRNPQYEARQLLRGNLLFSLRQKRNGLKAAIEEERRFFREFIDERASLVHYLHACACGYLVFDQHLPQNEKSPFLELALDELLRSPEVPWFTLDQKGLLCAHSDCERLQFDVIAFTSATIRAHAGEESDASIRELIRQSVYTRYVAETNVLYDKIVQGRQWSDIRRLRDDEAREMCVDCMRRWIVCYRAYPERGMDFLKKAIDELSGNGFFIWMHFRQDTLDNHPDSTALGFNAIAAFRSVEALPLPWTKEHLEQRIVDKLFQRHILPSYDKIQARDETRRIEMISLIQQVLRGYQTDPQTIYLDWIYREITEEVKFRWIDIAQSGEWRSIDKVPPHFNPMELLEKLAETHPNAYGLFETRRKLAENRFREVESIYFREISERSFENGIAERSIAIDIFQKIKGIFKFFPELHFLDIPLTELNGRGRIRWQARFLGVFTVPENHYENLMVNFDYKAERAEFQMFRDEQYHWLGQMLRDLDHHE